MLIARICQRTFVASMILVAAVSSCVVIPSLPTFANIISPLLVLLALSGACTVEVPIPLEPFRVCLDGNPRFVQPRPGSHGLAAPVGLRSLLARIRKQKEHVPLRGYRASDRPDRAPEYTSLFRSFSARTNPLWRGLCIKPQIITMLYASHPKQLSITRVPIHEKRVRARSNTRILNMRLLLPAWPIVTDSSGRLSSEACPPKGWPPRPEPRLSKRWNWTIPSPKLRHLWRPCVLTTTGTGPPPQLDSSAPSNSIRATPPPTNAIPCI